MVVVLDQEVLIQRSSPQVVISDQDTAELVIDVAATVDADGKYQVTPLGTGRVLEFSFILENAEWRLSRVPDATVLLGWLCWRDIRRWCSFC